MSKIYTDLNTVLTPYATAIKKNASDIDELNGSLYTETNIIEEEEIGGEDITYVSGNRELVNNYNVDAFIPRTGIAEAFYLKQLDIRASAGTVIQIALGTVRNLYPDPSTLNYQRSRFTKTQILATITADSTTHAVYEPSDPVYIDNPNVFILVSASTKTIGLRTNAEGYNNGVMFSQQNNCYYYNGTVGTEITDGNTATMFFFDPEYVNPDEEPTAGQRVAFSMTYSLAEPIIIRHVTNVKEAVKGLLEDSESHTGAYNVLGGKKWAACGDSITYGATGTSYKDLIATRNGMNLYSDGISGSTLMQIDPNDVTYKNPFCIDRMLDVPADCDYITIWFGTNDAALNGTVGTITDNVPTTYYGAWNIVMTYLINKCPNAKIGLVVTHQYRTNDYANAVRDIAKKYGVLVFDIPGDPKIPYWHPSSANAEYVDASIKALRDSEWWTNPAHPSTAGYEYISYPFENWMRSL